MNQELLCFGEPEAPSKRKLTIGEQFEVLLAEHPDVPLLFERFAREVRDAGRESFGAKAIVERLRWYYATSTQGETPKLNNNFTAYLSRWLMERDPSFVGFFETRELRSR